MACFFVKKNYNNDICLGETFVFGVCVLTEFVRMEAYVIASVASQAERQYRGAR